MEYRREDVERQGRRQLWITGAFFALALLVANLPDGAQQSVATALRSTVLRPFVSMQRMVTRARLRALETSRLQALLDSTVAELANTVSLAEENERLRGLLELDRRLGSAFRAASVTRSGTPGSESVFLLDLGDRDGVRPNAPVIVRDGLVGKVIEVGVRESTAMDWTHPDFRASAMTADGRVYGLVEPDRGAFREADRLLLNGIPFFTELEPGTSIVTSGRGGVFPRGIPIGTVVELYEADERWRRSYWLRPAARPGSALQVLVRVGPAQASPEDLGPAFDGTVPAAADTSGSAPGTAVPDTARRPSAAPGMPPARSNTAPGAAERPGPGTGAGVRR